MKISNLTDAQFKTLVIRMLKERREDLNSIKEIQLEINTLIKIKKNLQGNNSKMGIAGDQINDLEYKEAKNHHAEQEEKKNPKQ